MVLGTPVVAITILLVIAERALHLGFFDPARGGDPVLFQHLFWFYSHPAVYIMILPAMGVISELVAAVSRKTIFGYGFVAFSSLAIAIIGFLVWGHHLFVSSQSIYAGLVFSILSMLVAYIDQTKSGSRNHVSPGARMRCTVTMKLKPVRMDENPAMKTPVAASVTFVCVEAVLYGV
jgi:hypothetical protein